MSKIQIGQGRLTMAIFHAMERQANQFYAWFERVVPSEKARMVIFAVVFVIAFVITGERK